MRLAREARTVSIPNGDGNKESGGDFVRLWLVLAFAYALVKFAFELAVGGYVDLRGVALWGLLVVPFGQAVVISLVRRRFR